MRTLVLGGIRSGKSRWAEELIARALSADETVRYLATGPAADTDGAWASRVAEHRNRRPAHWSTVETHDIATQLRQSPHCPTLIDDVGGWLTSTFDSLDAWEDGSVAGPVNDMLSAVGEFGAPLVLVSPEVGLAVVPATASGRRFADELGSLNQRLAAVCDQVVLVVAGQAVPIKAPITSPQT
ncbi:MAG: bifunctional adenosylcobinamide kinase/adenosylcobinamide-phosphate guanylyltransferase [Mycobacterium sp.]